MKPDFVYTKADGETVECYGEIKWDSNFELICDDEDFDGVAVDINGETHNSWEKVCKHVIENYRADLVEISSC